MSQISRLKGLVKHFKRTVEKLIRNVDELRRANDRIQTLEDEYAELENTNDALRAQLILNTTPKPTKKGNNHETT